MRPVIKDYASAEAYLKGARETWRRNRVRKIPSQRATDCTRIDAHSIAIYYHATPVVTYHDDGTITLRNGGWFTPTTKARIWEYAGIHLSTWRGQWFFGSAWRAADRRAAIPWHEGIRIRNGKPVDPPKPLTFKKSDELCIGWRGYQIVSDNEGKRVLRGGFGMDWTSRYFKAECHCTPKHPSTGAHLRELARQPDCEQINNGCGIYSLNSAERLVSHGYSVIAQCVCYGDVLVTTHGYKASHVRIDRLYFLVESLSDYHVRQVVYPATEELAARYDVPCELIERSQFLTRYCANHDEQAERID